MHKTVLLQTLAAVSWTATIVGTFTGFDDDPRTFSAVDFRVWLLALSAAILSTVAVMAGYAARTYTAVTKAAVTRPLDAARPSGPTGPLARLVTTGPLAKLVALPGTHHGQHARH